jgi:predicted transcriptional regulator
MNATSNSDAAKLSVEDTILEYLSKKSVIDQTEKLALARISSKLEITNEQVETYIGKLSAKNLIRRIYSQGKVGFELTPRGKSAIEVLAKAETERITRQLQEAIHEERKAKLRLNTVNKMKSIEEDWQNYQIPDRKFIHEIEQETTKHLASTKEIEREQPLCQVTKQNYDQEFSKYKPKIEKLAEQNSKLSKIVDTYAKIKSQLLSICTDIENLNKTISKYENISEATAQVGQLKNSLLRLKAIQVQLASFDEDQIARFAGLKIQLADNSRLLEILKKPTHEFMATKKESSTEKTTNYPDPECPIKYGHKTSEYRLVEKCSKCGTSRRSTPVNIG